MYFNKLKAININFVFNQFKSSIYDQMDCKHWFHLLDIVHISRTLLQDIYPYDLYEPLLFY